MDGMISEGARLLHLRAADLDPLMPLHVCICREGRVFACGPTMVKLLPEGNPVGRSFFDLFEIRRPAGLIDFDSLRNAAGRRLFCCLRAAPAQIFRAIATPLLDDNGLILNLSFGATLVDAVRDHALTDADFAPTDLAVELLYLVEAKSAVMEELRALNLRLQGAKVAAEEQAMTDTLTGLRNRRALDLALGQVALGVAPFSVMHIDLDYFKAVNDSLGHAAGDCVLRKVADVLRAETRVNDTVARVGGDEFVIVLPGLVDAERLLRTAERIIAKLSEPIAFEGAICRISASVGMTMSHFYNLPQPEQMLIDADQALYASKRAGRACAQIFKPEAAGD